MSARPSECGAGAAPFFQLGASYLIAPESRLEDLLNDCKCLLDLGIGGIEGESCDDFTSAQWAGLYALRQAVAVFDECSRRVFAGETIAEGKS